MRDDQSVQYIHMTMHQCVDSTDFHENKIYNRKHKSISEHFILHFIVTLP